MTASATEGLETLIVGPSALVAALCCYAAWCLRPRSGLAFTTIGLAVLGCQEIARAGVLLVSGERVTAWRALESDAWPTLVAVAVVAVTHHVRMRPDPAAVGFGIGVLVAACRLAGLNAPAEHGQDLLQWAVCVAYAVVVLGLALVVSRGGELAPQVEPMQRSARLLAALAIVIVGAAHLTSYWEGTPATRAWVVAGATAGAALLVSTCLALFLGEVESAKRSRDTLDHQLESAWRVDRAHRARLHEIHSTIAGIASASQLLRSVQEISEQRRRRLDEMVSAELGRLERLIAQDDACKTSWTAGSEDRPADPMAIDLDAAIGPIVLSHEARGHGVRWSPSGRRVRAQPDAVAAMFNVLLDNAAQHGRSAAEVTMEQRGGYVEVAVHDNGPGVEPCLRTRLFEWGARGARSTGQGIGLHLAHELAQQQGGYLRTRDVARDGATFVLGLPLERTDDQRDEHHGHDGSSLAPGIV
jgi:signal transduction histidine kinase